MLLYAVLRYVYTMFTLFYMVFTQVCAFFLCHLLWNELYSLVVPTVEGLCLIGTFFTNANRLLFAPFLSLVFNFFLLGHHSKLLELVLCIFVCLIFLAAVQKFKEV